MNGCFTALITPFKNDAVDYDGLSQLVAFQIENGITGILAVGTTGESPTLSVEEHHQVVDLIAKLTHDKCRCIAGTGGNDTRRVLSASQHAVDRGVDALLLVDPYYNGPSSLEIRHEYVAPVAERFPSVDIIPYVIPGRTGAQLLPEDLALLHKAYPNVRTVKEATGNLKNMQRTRACCGSEFTILSGDDGLTFDMMTDPAIQAGGVISVISNIAPKAVTQMVHALTEGDRHTADRLKASLDPLFGLVTVTTTESTPFGDVTFRARNPLALKSLMALFGMPGGPCRPPLGKMTPKAMTTAVEAVRTVHDNDASILGPLESFFGIDLRERINNARLINELCYSAY